MVDPATRNAVARVPRALLDRARKRVGADHVTLEMLQAQIEIVSPVLESMQAARAEMTRLRNGLIEAAHELGYRVLAAGTHPLGAWRRQAPSERPRYARLIDDFQIVGRRNLLCGLHVHVAVGAGIDRIVLMNRMMRWLPVFLALSTSSPFWSRERTGLLSYRQAAYDEWPRTGIPDFFESQDQHDAFVDLLRRSGSIDDAGSLWWAIRPAAAYPTLELRIADACTDLEDALALAALFRCLVRAHLRLSRLGAVRSAMTRRIIDENRWRAKRHAIDAEFIDEERGTVLPFREVLAELRALVAEDAQALDCAAELAHLDVIVHRGTSANRQLARYRQRIDEGMTRIDALRDVVDWLVETSAPRPPGRA